jgi:hypothetical protein
MIFITHESALEFWMRYRGGRPSQHLKQNQQVPGVRSEATAEAIEERLKEAGGIDAALGRLGIIKRPVHVLSGREHFSRTSNSIVAHQLTEPLPRGSFYAVSPDVNVASPELCFVQLARRLDLVDAVRLGYNLCALCRGAAEADASPVKLREPVTDIGRIRSYVDRYYKAPDRSQPGKAARYIAAGEAASPMEAFLAMSLCLPTVHGGYQLPLPVLNQPVKIGSYASGLTQRSKVVCDLYWPDQRLDVEYDSDQFHSDSRQRGLDSNRWSVLRKMGIKLVPVTTWQFKRPTEFEAVVKSIRSGLGLRAASYSNEVFWRRCRLRQRLINPSGDWLANSLGDSDD